MSAGSEKRNRARDKVRRCLLSLKEGEEVFSGDIASRTGLSPFSVGKILIACSDIVDRIPDTQKKGGQYRYRRRDDKSQAED